MGSRYAHFEASPAAQDQGVNQSYSKIVEMVRASSDRFKKVLDAVNESKLDRFAELLNSPG